MSLHYLKIALLVAVLSSLARANDPLLELADSLKCDGFFNEAITEYKRYLFFNPDREHASDAHSEICYCYVRLERWDMALAAADMSIRLTRIDSLASERRIDRAAVLLASGDFGGARDQLKGEIALLPQENIKRRAGTLLFLSEVLENDWEAALEDYRIFVNARTGESDACETILTEACNRRRKSPDTAMLLSTLIPGLGQVYAGKWLAGMDALALNAGLGYWTISDLTDGRYISGLSVFTFLLRRYFSGNRLQAYELAVQDNAEKDARSEQGVRDWLSTRFGSGDNKGLQPIPDTPQPR